MNYDSFLKDKLRRYPNADLARKDVQNALRMYKDLKPKQEKFVHNDGKENDLVCLEGTVPVNYKGATYNIPIAVWLYEPHPFVPPLVFVKPTSTMQIKPGRHVDTNGRVYLPFLHEWSHPKSDLLGLISVLCVVFSEEPPVFSRPSGNYPPPRPPFPQSTPYGSGGGYPTPSPYPQHTAGGIRMPMPTPGSHAVRPGPVQPPYPPQGAISQHQSPYPTYSQPVGSSEPQYPPARPSYPPPTTVQSHTPLKSQNSVSEETIKASILSAVEDKIRLRLRETLEQGQAEIDALNKVNDDLNKGSHKIQEIMEKLEKEQEKVDNNIKMLQQKDDEIKELIDKLENESGKLDIDDAVITTAPLYNQILNLFAEENAVEDTIYYLGEALRRETIDLDVFLKNVRTLSRKQFQLRALLQKARKTAGLRDIA